MSGCSVQPKCTLVTPTAKPNHALLLVSRWFKCVPITSRALELEDASSPATFGKGGFRRMVEEGFACRDHHFGYALTYTGPGHASIYTGTTPVVHGILANDWYDAQPLRGVLRLGHLGQRGAR